MDDSRPAATVASIGEHIAIVVPLRAPRRGGAGNRRIDLRREAIEEYLAARPDQAAARTAAERERFARDNLTTIVEHAVTKGSRGIAPFAIDATRDGRWIPDVITLAAGDL